MKHVGRHRHHSYEFEVHRSYLVVIHYVVFTCVLGIYSISVCLEALLTKEISEPSVFIPRIQ